MNSNHHSERNPPFSALPYRTTSIGQSFGARPSPLSLTNAAGPPFRSNNGFTTSESFSGAVNNTARVDQQLHHARTLPSQPQRFYNIGCQSITAPGREIFMYAQSMQLIKEIQARGFSSVTMTCDTLERVFNYIGNLQRQYDHFIAKFTKTPSNRQSNVPRRPTPPAVPAKAFKLFPKLPLEVRRIIWNLALYTPTTISADITIPRPFLNPIYTQPITNLRTICRESRIEAIKAQVPLNKPIVGQKTFFINPTVDILWLSAWGISDDEWILVFTILHGLLAHKRLPKIAVSLDLWDRLMSGNDTRSRFLNAVSAYKTEEVVIVMGNTSVFGSPSLVLREPRGKPRAVLHTNFISRFRELPDEVTWEELDRTLLSEIERSKSARHEVRQRMRDAGLNPDHAHYRGRFVDVSHWDYKKVHFMEAATYTAMEKE